MRIPEVVALVFKAHEVEEYCIFCERVHVLIAGERIGDKEPFRICPDTLNSFGLDDVLKELKVGS